MDSDSPEFQARLFCHSVLAARHAGASWSWLFGSFDDPCLGPPWGPLSRSTWSLSNRFQPFTCKDMSRNHRYSISPSNHPPKHHYKIQLHSRSTSTSFRTSKAFLDVWPLSTSKHYILPVNKIINHFKTLNHHETNIRAKNLKHHNTHVRL